MYDGDRWLPDGGSEGDYVWLPFEFSVGVVPAVGASYSVTDITFAKTTARYVRMDGTQRGAANGYSLFAFMVLDDP
jgi:hypothetical protein